MRVGRTMIRGSISNIAAVSATEISARKPLARPSMPYAGTHKVRIDSRRVTPQTAAKIARDQNTPRNMTSRRRRHTKDPRTNAVVKKAPATMASEMAFSQINSGFHSRHAPCGMSIDMSRISPRRSCKGATAIRSAHRDNRADHSGFSANRASATLAGEVCRGDLGASGTRLLHFRKRASWALMPRISAPASASPRQRRTSAGFKLAGGHRHAGFAPRKQPAFTNIGRSDFSPSRTTRWPASSASGPYPTKLSFGLASAARIRGGNTPPATQSTPPNADVHWKARASSKGKGGVDAGEAGADRAGLGVTKSADKKIRPLSESRPPFVLRAAQTEFMMANDLR